MTQACDSLSHLGAQAPLDMGLKTWYSENTEEAVLFPEPGAPEMTTEQIAAQIVVRQLETDAFRTLALKIVTRQLKIDRRNGIK